MIKLSKCVVFLLIVTSLYVYFDRVCCRKMAQFYNLDRQCPNTIEVLGIGSSHMYCTLNTMRLYEKFGIKAYILASSGQQPIVSYYFLRQAFKSNQRPKIVLVELFGFISGLDSIPYRDAHSALDNMPWGIDKIGLIWNMRVDVPKSEFIFNMLRYHPRWKELEPWEFDAISHPYYDRCRGFVPFWTISKGKADLSNREGGESQGEKPNFHREILDEIVSYCESQGSKVTFMIAPFDGMWQHAEVIMALRKYADDRHIPLIEFTHEGGVNIDSQYDFTDITHLNAMGAEKVTDYVGTYLLREFGNCELGNTNDDPEWVEALEEYKKQREEFLKSGVYGGTNNE